MSELDLIIFIFIITIFTISLLLYVKTLIEIPEFIIKIQIIKKEEK